MNKKLVAFFVCMLLIATTIVFVPKEINVKADPGGGEEQIGYELIDNNTILHIWNNYDSYYFNVDSGIQLTNYYNEYWSHNILMLGYYNNDKWNLIYRTDELSGFNKDIDTDDETYINATLWKDLAYQGYDFRLAIRYHLGMDDNDLTIIPYIKNLGIAIPFQMGFGWEMKDINIANVNNDNYLQIYNGTSFERISLNQTLNRNFTDMDYNTSINLICTNPPSPYLSRNLYLKWNHTLNYKVTVKNRTGQYNAPVTLFIRVGTLDVGQEKSTEMHWLDSDDWLGISSDEYENHCGEEATGTLADALDGLDRWEHYDDETHWVILDLGETYAIKKIRGRSDGVSDPTDVNIYIDDNNPPTTLVKEGITTWQDTSDWVEIIIPERASGRYIKVEIITTEQPGGEVEWGRRIKSFTIFDAYGDVVPNTAPIQSGEVPSNSSTGISMTPDLYVLCTDADNDNLNATWWSNSSGDWLQFASNWTSFTNNTNITQQFTNASAYGTIYYWSVNLSDGTDWTNNTYHFTTESDDYEIVWDVEEENATYAMKVATDTNNDVIAVGIANNLNGYIVKYNGTNGEILWDENVTELEANPNPQPIDMEEWVYLELIGEFFNIEIEAEAVWFMNVITDSENNIIAAAHIIYEIINLVPVSDIYVIKYDPDGNKLWDKLIDIGILDWVFGITVDDNDNIYISGLSVNGLPVPHLEGWVYKLGKNYGVTHWHKHTNPFRLPQPAYEEIVIDSYNKVYVVGTICDIEWDGDEGTILGKDMIVVKYDGATGLKLDEEIIEYEQNSMGIAITVDDNDDVFICGDISDSHEIIKFDSDLNEIWSLTNNNISVDGHLHDIDIINGSNIVVTGDIDSDRNFSTTIYDGETGTQCLLEIREGFFYEPPPPPFNQIDAWAKGVAVDSNNDIVTTGYRHHWIINTDYFYTMKYHIIKQL